MARSKHKTTNYLFLIVFGTLGVLLGFKVYYDKGAQYPKSLSDFNETGDYKIDPKNILSEIDQGKTDVFQPIMGTPTNLNTPFPMDFSWKQSDYLRVASVLHQSVWNDSLDDWHIFGMQFFKDCQNEPIGPGSAHITFYKDSAQQEGYTVHEIDIYPSGNGVSWGGGDGWPRPLFGWKSINLNRLRVTADDALHVTEENGGREFRVAHNNECEIHSSLRPTITGDKWIVAYFANSSSDIFEYHIDSYTDLH
jgi:hypothetical protein